TFPDISSNTRSAYIKVMDRKAWTHALGSAAVVVEISDVVCSRARIVLVGGVPIPWRLNEVENMSVVRKVGRRLTRSAGADSVQGALPLEKNRYQLKMASAVIERTLTPLGV